MSKKDALGDRMKESYENRSKTYLTRRVPVILRLDGKAWHTLTRGFQRPYDKFLHEAMNATMLYLCKNIQGCKLGYTQSDEITLVLTDYDTITTDAWFDYGVQKICSVAASMATLEFNRAFEKATRDYRRRINNCFTCTIEENKLVTAYEKALAAGAMFDCRAFSVPEEEVVNVLIWRQQDATRNAIQMLGQTHFSHKELHKKNVDQIQEMLFSEKGINFNDMPAEFKRGVCCVRKNIQNPNVDIKDGFHPKNAWVIDTEIPIFTKEREYITSVLPKKE